MGLTPFQATGCTVVQVVSHWPLTMEEWVQPQANSCGICSGQSNNGIGFSQGIVVSPHQSGFGGLEVACWPLVPKFVGSHPAEAVILSTSSFGGEVKPSVPCHSFMACKRSLNITWNSTFRQNYRTFLAYSSTFHRWVLSHGDTRGDAWWRKL
jgi:hypothetical protein